MRLRYRIGSLTKSQCALFSYLRQEERKPASNDQKRLKQMEWDMARSRDFWGKKEREMDRARAAVQV